MGPGVRRAWAVAIIAATVWGCAAMTESERSLTPVKQVKAALEGAAAGLAAQSVSQMMAWTSDDFSNSQGLDKPAIHRYLDGIHTQGGLTGVWLNLSECEIVIDDDKATASPVIVESPSGIQEYVYRFRKEADGVWRIVNSELID